mgnify:CR=1 FL=1
MEGLERFLEAQDSRNSGYETAIREIKYGISSLLEAKAYLEHPVLGARLREAVLAMTAHAGSETADDSGVFAATRQDGRGTQRGPSRPLPLFRSANPSFPVQRPSSS